MDSMCPQQQRPHLGLHGQATPARTTSTVAVIPAIAMAIPMATTAILAMAIPAMATATRVSGEQQQEAIYSGYIYCVLYSGTALNEELIHCNHNILLW